MGKVGRPQNFYIRKAWKKCQNEGMTQAEAARALGKSRAAASKAAKRYGFKFMTKDDQKRWQRKAQAQRVTMMIYDKLKRCSYASDEAYAMVVAAVKRGKK